MSRRLWGALALAPLAAALWATPASAASLSLSHSGDPTQDKAVAITASGSTESGRYLYVYAEPNASDCASTAYEEGLRPQSSTLSSFANYEGSGSFSQAYSFTPTTTNSYRVCAYLADSDSSSPAASAADGFIPRRAHASVGADFSADPTEERPVAVTITGSTEVGRTLYAYADKSGSGCAPTAYEEGLRPQVRSLSQFSGGDYEPAGNFSENVSFTPADVTTYHLCSYVTRDAGSTPDAAGDTALVVRPPHASVSISPGPFNNKQPVIIGVSGNTEVERNLYLYAEPNGSACGATAFAEAARPGVVVLIGGYGGSDEPAGNFNETVSFQPQAPGYFLCAYVSESDGTAPNAIAGVQLGTAAIVVARSATPSCSESAAQSALSHSSINTWARHHFHLALFSMFGVTKIICRDLTGDRRPEMTVLLGCCTISSPTPLAIFRPSGTQWKLVYTSTKRLIYRLGLKKRDLLERTPIYRRRDALCCPSGYRKFKVHWNGHSFVSRKA